MFQNRHGLVHDVVHVGAGRVELFVGEHLLDPARVQVNEIAGTAAEIGQVLDGQPQAARAGRAGHQPGAAAREMRVGDFGGEFLVIHFVIVPADALFGHAGGAAGFKNVEGAALEFFGHPDFRLQIAQPFVLEMGKRWQSRRSL